MIVLRILLLWNLLQRVLEPNSLLGSRKLKLLDRERPPPVLNFRLLDFPFEFHVSTFCAILTVFGECRLVFLEVEA